MNAGERAYLLHKAHMLWRMTKEAADKGEEFTPTFNFDEIENGLEAQARIFVDEDGKAVMALCFRYVENGKEKADTSASKFFTNDDYWVLPELESNGYKYAAYKSTVIPAPVIPQEK